MTIVFNTNVKGKVDHAPVGA